MRYERSIMASIRTELSRPTPVIHVLIGARQVGKTTIARQIEASIGIPTIYATADSPVPLDSAWIDAQWRRALAGGAAASGPLLLILDEVTSRILEEHFQEDLSRSEEIDLTRWRNRSLAQRALEAAIEPVRRWL